MKPEIDWSPIVNGLALAGLIVLAAMMVMHEVPAGSSNIVAGIAGALGGFLTGGGKSKSTTTPPPPPTLPQ
jgi:hypothetical protein